MFPRGLADLGRGDGRDPIGPRLRLIEREPQPLQLQQALGPLLDGLEVEDPGAGQVSAGAIDLFVGEGAWTHGADLVGDRGDDPIGLFGHGAGIDAEEAGEDVGRVGDPAADRIDQPQLVADDPAQAVAEPRPAAEDMVEDDAARRNPDGCG